MHRDIKGPNVMLTNRAEIRLIDFGKSSCHQRLQRDIVSCSNSVYFLNSLGQFE